MRGGGKGEGGGDRDAFKTRTHTSESGGKKRKTGHKKEQKSIHAYSKTKDVVWPEQAAIANPAP